jgi:shikimate dehydrogenase
MRAAVLGHPVGHSLSPLLHQAAYTALGLHGWRYDRVDVPEDRFLDFVACLSDDWAGLSLTMPLKVVAAQVATTCSSTVTRTGVSNTLILQDGIRHAENTDVAGVVGALAEAGVHSIDAGVLLGAGATARSAAVALESLGARTVVVAGRRAGSAAAIREVCPDIRVIECSFDATLTSHLLAAQAVVSTIPATATDAVVNCMPGTVHGHLLDVVYDPWPTPLASAWTRAGGHVIPGTRMLLHQAFPQVEMMTGRSLDPEVRSRMSEALGLTPR